MDVLGVRVRIAVRGSRVCDGGEGKKSSSPSFLTPSLSHMLVSCRVGSHGAAVSQWHYLGQRIANSASAETGDTALLKTTDLRGFLRPFSVGKDECVRLR